MPKINRKQLILEVKTAEKVLVKAATEAVKQNYFDPAVKKLKKDFENHPVSIEIDEGVEAKNESNTLIGGSSTEGKNLYSFIGFEEGSDPLEPIRDRLDPNHPDGPKFKYIRGSQSNNIEFKFQVSAPNLDKIFESTPMPWANGLSWAQRIEQGIPGFSKFLNKIGIKNSRSGGGIQVKNELRQAKYKPVKYLTDIVNKFISNINNLIK